MRLSLDRVVAHRSRPCGRFALRASRSSEIRTQLTVQTGKYAGAGAVLEALH